MASAPANGSSKQTIPIVSSSKKQSRCYIGYDSLQTWAEWLAFIVLPSMLVFLTFWSLYKAIQALILPKDSSSTDGYLFLLIFLTMIILGAYMLIAIIPCGIHFRLIIVAKFTVLLHSVLSYCREQYYLLLTKMSNLLSKLSMKLKFTYRLSVDLNEQNTTII